MARNLATASIVSFMVRIVRLCFLGILIVATLQLRDGGSPPPVLAPEEILRQSDQAIEAFDSMRIEVQLRQAKPVSPPLRRTTLLRWRHCPGYELPDTM
jgi:hypothetical protein